MKISRLYLKIYFYFLGIILIVFILVPVLFFFSVDKPYKNILEKRLVIMGSLVKSSLFRKDLRTAIDDIAKETGCEVTIYDERGEARISSSQNTDNLNEEMMEKTKKKGFYMDISRKKHKLLFLIPVNDDNSSYAYMSFLTDLGDPKERRNRFFLWLIILCLLLSLLIYPLVMNITRPLEKITQKAIRFSKGDFTGFEKKDGKQAGGDEIFMLNSAFNHMASELITMIEAKKELLSDISHELGSPLSRMKVATEIIDDKVKAGKFPSGEIIKGLSDDIDEMAKLVKELLEFSKMDLKVYSLNIKPCDMEELVSSVVRSFQSLAGKNNIAINIKKEGIFSEMPVDSDKVARVLENLLSNAIKYSPQESNIEVLLKGEKEHFSLSVIDQGPGIGKENGEKIFEPFFREDPSRARGTGGAGLGLAIAKKIINLHGGSIWVDNPGKAGAIIIFKI